MLSRRIVVTTLVVSTLGAACAEQPTAPQRAVPNGDAPIFSAAAGATVDRGTGVFTIHDAGYQDCVGEVVAFDAEVPFRYQTIVTPSGRTIHLEPFIPHAGTGTAIGQTSGTVWILDRVVSPLVAQSTGTTESLHWTGWQRWVSETGPTMHLFSMFHVSQNAQGEITAAKIVMNRCQLQ